jgi:ribonuclease T1
VRNHATASVLAWLRCALWSLAMLVALLGQGLALARQVDEPSEPVRTITVDALPPEARDTLASIRRGGPFPYAKDAAVFANRERLLPRQPRGHYTEYTVPTPGARDRGARRIVAGGDPRTSGEYWYTDDHYRSFRRIRASEEPRR